MFYLLFVVYPNNSDMSSKLILVVNLDPGTHGRSDRRGEEVGTFARRGFRLDDGFHQRREVVEEFVFAEARLADRAVERRLFVNSVLDFTGFDILDGFRDVHGDGARFGSRHKSFRSEEFTQTTDQTHHIRRGDADVKVKPSALDLLDDLFGSDDVGSGGGRFVGLGALGDDQNTERFAGPVRENDDASDLLVGVTGVDAETAVELDGLVEFRLAGFDGEFQRLSDFVRFGSVVRFDRIYVFLTAFHSYTSRLVDDDDAHAAGGAGDHAASGLQRGCVEVGHFGLGDLFDLRFGDLGDFVTIGFGGAALDAAGFLDEHGCGRGLELEREAAVGVDRDDDGDDESRLRRGLFVEFFGEHRYGDAVRSEGGAYGRSRGCLTCG